MLILGSLQFFQTIVCYAEASSSMDSIISAESVAPLDSYKEVREYVCQADGSIWSQMAAMSANQEEKR